MYSGAMANSNVGMLHGDDRIEKGTYKGPFKFRGTCENCGKPRNFHCGRCKGCPKLHVASCLTGYATGAWH